jgi:F-type H+-transporting ATPase subunit delta
MSELTVAGRYAKSIIDLAEEQNLVEPIKGDMELFLRTLKANPQLKAVVANPIVPHSKKIKILNELFATKMNKLSISFFKLMVDKGRGEVLFTTAAEYVNLFDIKNHIVHASVTSASPLSDDNKQKMIADIKAATGGSVKLNESIDPSLIGGFVLTVGDRQVDTSISSDLQKLKKEFAARAIKN